MVDQAEIHRKAVSSKIEERKDAAYQFKYNFAVLPDKEQVWEDLVRLTHDENGGVRWHAIYAIDVAFQHVSDKEHAWKDLHRLTQCEDSFVRLGVASAIGTAFQHIPDKEQAWGDLRRLTHDEDSLVRPSAVGALGAAFQHMPDKKQVWDDLHRLVQEDEDHYVKSDAARAIGTAFQHIPDKKQAWEDVHRLTQRRDSSIRSNAARAIGFAFQHILDKKQAWEDLHWLAQDEDSYVRRMVVYALGDTFQHIPDKEAAWQDLHWLTGDEDGFVRLGAARALGSAFQHIPEKDDAWNDLHRMILNEDRDIQHHAVYALGLAFPHVTDKKQAWKILHRLTNDKDDGVRRSATDALGSDFQYIPEKEEAWKDLHRLTGDEDLLVRLGAACALGSNFQHIPEKDEAWRDLIRLTVGEDGFIRAYANHSLGRASIFKATETESKDDFKSELKNALEFFGASSKEDTHYNNPSRFCLPFYRSFYTITFEKARAEDEVQKYLTEAKSASEGSKNKEQLIEAVENLANALSEAQKVTDFDATKSDLKAYMQYCDRAADLIGDAAEDAPGAARVLRRGLPIIDDRIKEIIREIQEKARAVYREAQGTSLEELGLATARSAQELPTQDPLALTMALGSMVSIARGWCEYLPTDKKVDACEQLKNLTDMELSEQGVALVRVFEYVQENIHIPKIQTVHISETEQKIVRIAVAQISFELTESFPFTIKKRDEVKTKIFSALEIAKQNGANIVCLPELCLYEEWIGDIKRKYPDMIVIGGSFYKDNMNICPVIMESCTDIPYQPKITPSPFEDGIMGPRMVPGDIIYRYETRFGKFVILICMDFDDLAHFFRETESI